MLLVLRPLVELVTGLLEETHELRRMAQFGKEPAASHIASCEMTAAHAMGKLARTNPNGFGADEAASSSSSGGQAMSPVARKLLAVELEVSARFDILFLLRTPAKQV